MKAFVGSNPAASTVAQLTKRTVFDSIDILVKLRSQFATPESRWIEVLPAFVLSPSYEKVLDHRTRHHHCPTPCFNNSNQFNTTSSRVGTDAAFARTVQQLVRRNVALSDISRAATLMSRKKCDPGSALPG